MAARRGRALSPLFWKTCTLPVVTAVTEHNLIDTEVIVASSHGKTKAWEIRAWGLTPSNQLGPDIPAAGLAGEYFGATMSHNTGLAAPPAKGEESYIDHFFAKYWGDAAKPITNIEFEQEGKWHHDLELLHGGPEVYVDETLHIYTLSSFSVSADIPCAVQFRWIVLTAQALFTLREKYR